MRYLVLFTVGDETSTSLNVDKNVTLAEENEEEEEEEKSKIGL